MATLEGNKAKTARRVVEVLEFFDEHHRHVTVMDIVRRYNRPQSSTSELLASLVELGLLYKDSGSRSYTLTPRAAILGSLSQPSLVRDGTLSMLIDRLVAQTGLGTALFGMVRLNAQVFRWCAGSKHVAHERGQLASGAQERLCESAAGWLLLSTNAPAYCERVVRRLNAEAPADRKFNYASMLQRVQECGRRGYAIGPAAFGSSAEMAAILLPVQPGESPMAMGFVYQPNDQIESMKLVELLQSSVQRCIRHTANQSDLREVVSNAA
jgi:DNA-binding IclR family transcriptional regulator